MYLLSMFESSIGGKMSTFIVNGTNISLFGFEFEDWDSILRDKKKVCFGLGGFEFGFDKKFDLCFSIFKKRSS